MASLKFSEFGIKLFFSSSYTLKGSSAFWVLWILNYIV